MSNICPSNRRGSHPYFSGFRTFRSLHFGPHNWYKLKFSIDAKRSINSGRKNGSLISTVKYWNMSTVSRANVKYDRHWRSSCTNWRWRVCRFSSPNSFQVVSFIIISCVSWMRFKYSKHSSNRKVVSFISMLTNFTNCEPLFDSSIIDWRWIGFCHMLLNRWLMWYLRHSNRSQEKLNAILSNCEFTWWWIYRKTQCFVQSFQCRCRISSVSSPDRFVPAHGSLSAME